MITREEAEAKREQGLALADKLNSEILELRSELDTLIWEEVYRVIQVDKVEERKIKSLMKQVKEANATIMRLQKKVSGRSGYTDFISPRLRTFHHDLYEALQHFLNMDLQIRPALVDQKRLAAKLMGRLIVNGIRESIERSDPEALEQSLQRILIKEDGVYRLESLLKNIGRLLEFQKVTLADLEKAVTALEKLEKEIPNIPAWKSAYGDFNKDFLKEVGTEYGKIKKAIQELKGLESAKRFENIDLSRITINTEIKMIQTVKEIARLYQIQI